MSEPSSLSAAGAGAANSTRVLVVDDEPPILRALGTNLRARDYTVDLAPSGEEALALAARHRPDAVILDLGLPGLSGIEVIEGLRGWTSVPIIILSARGAERDKVAALKKQGQSLNEVLAAKPTAAYDAKWGSVIVPDLFTRFVYAGV